MREGAYGRGGRLMWLAGGVVAVVALYVVLDFLTTLERLEAVERERDTWQRPGDIVRALALGDGAVVADIGCGSGYLALKLARVVGARGRVVALDVRELPVFVIRFRAWRARLESLRAVRVPPEDPLLPAGGVDAAVVLNTYHELGDPAAMLAKIHDGLRPGGRLVVVDRRPRAVEAGARPGDHEVPASVVQVALQDRGFTVTSRDDTFIDRPGDADVWWMLVARRD